MARPDSRFIFVSFKTEEKEHALLLKTALEEEGYEVWWQEDLQCGQAWHEEIDKAVGAASCIIVIWSEAAMHSRWVQHEASQAIVRDVYAPVRIDQPMAIQSPFDRRQATDIYDWDGDKSHPGFQNLLTSLKELIPTPLTKRQKVGRFLRRQWVAILAIGTVIASFTILANMRQDFILLNTQQQEVFTDVKRQLNPLDSLAFTLRFSVDEHAPGLQRLLQSEIWKKEYPGLDLIALLKKNPGLLAGDEFTESIWRIVILLEVMKNEQQPSSLTHDDPFLSPFPRKDTLKESIYVLPPFEEISRHSRANHVSIDLLDPNFKRDSLFHVFDGTPYADLKRDSSIHVNIGFVLDKSALSKVDWLRSTLDLPYLDYSVDISFSGEGAVPWFTLEEMGVRLRSMSTTHVYRSNRQRDNKLTLPGRTAPDNYF